MFQIQFVVQAECQPDEQLRIVGNLPSLGQWNPAQGLKLEQYDDNEWESISNIDASGSLRFEFKIVKILKNGTALWESLPNNSNRKFKPKHHSQLQLKWSSELGKIVNLAKSSYQVKGLPGVIIKNVEGSGLIRRKTFDPDLEAKKNYSSSESQSDEQFESVVSRKRSADIRSLVCKGGIEQIYYETTQLQLASHRSKRNKIYIVCYSYEGKEEFCDELLSQIKQLGDSENISFKWLLFSSNEEFQTPKNRRRNSFQFVSFKKIEKQIERERINIDRYSSSNTHFVFIDLKSANMVDLGSVSACLFLHSSEYKELAESIEQLGGFKFVCFDSAEKNQELYQFIKQKRYSQIEEDNPINILEKKIKNISLEKIIEQLHFSNMKNSHEVNTVHTFTKLQAIQNINQNNSMLIIESELLRQDPEFFASLVRRKIDKRFVLIVHSKPNMPELPLEIKSQKNVFIVYDNWSKFFFLENKYEPLKKHHEIISILEMKLKILSESEKCSFEPREDHFVVRMNGKNEAFRETLVKDISKILKDFQYFKISSRENRIKITWNLSHQIRLLKTICKIKCMEEGQIGNFFMVTSSQDLQAIKEEIKTLIKTFPYYFKQGQSTQLSHYGYGMDVRAKFSIRKNSEETATLKQQ